jgi:hypothetical protein
MVTGIADMIAALSRVCTLEPGDLIATGTRFVHKSVHKPRDPVTPDRLDHRHAPESVGAHGTRVAVPVCRGEHRKARRIVRPAAVETGSDTVPPRRASFPLSLRRRARAGATIATVCADNR